MFIYALVMASVVNLSQVETHSYYGTHGECLVKKNELQDKQSTYIYDCWVVKIDGRENTKD